MPAFTSIAPCEELTQFPWCINALHAVFLGRLKTLHDPDQHEVITDDESTISDNTETIAYFFMLACFTETTVSITESWSD